ncbi:Asp23/Gls24 family envelope stress response protein [Jeotgalibacillus haloalkalitolerans]|uniref:Asp23/Gls24 family envelope stress response protein n=1 Tax=Jeotgalibacillus haloalkalitolerans TaxID=3104292 RepID=A0ABU5KN36_9BACL|nr:Asp23/Gls24 family envelope stress response protein [Jeotgalibacillus sp. HH7-29]MDZ5712125.1 Asp23/Gls24 family envelope stress response protein [Jeotgalibacillus sp. HH7-29]
MTAENENHLLQMSSIAHNQLGKVEIAPEVIEVIAGIAASEVDGIAQMRGNFASGVAERLGKKNHGKGIKVELGEEGITLDVYCTVKFGAAIPEVAQKLQDNIRQTLLNMTALEADEVNIHVVGIQFESAKADDDDKE